MNRKAWSSRIVVRYALLQIPALVLLLLMLALVQRWVSLPAWFIWGLIAFWIAKDVILFTFTWRAYDRSHKGYANWMIGLRGIAENRLAPSGYVHVHGELWQAELVEKSMPIEKGESVRIYGNRGLTLLVHRDNKESDGESKGGQVRRKHGGQALQKHDRKAL
jgi:membrane protein implicated in regulation of membrane protease activity